MVGAVAGEDPAAHEEEMGQQPGDPKLEGDREPVGLGLVPRQWVAAGASEHDGDEDEGEDGGEGEDEDEDEDEDGDEDEDEGEGEGEGEYAYEAQGPSEAVEPSPALAEGQPRGVGKEMDFQTSSF
jgi:hypothetical protein